MTMTRIFAFLLLLAAFPSASHGAPNPAPEKESPTKARSAGAVKRKMPKYTALNNPACNVPIIVQSSGPVVVALNEIPTKKYPIYCGSPYEGVGTFLLYSNPQTSFDVRMNLIRPQGVAKGHSLPGSEQALVALFGDALPTFKSAPLGKFTKYSVFYVGKGEGKPMIKNKGKTVAFYLRLIRQTEGPRAARGSARKPSFENLPDFIKAHAITAEQTVRLDPVFDKMTMGIGILQLKTKLAPAKVESGDLMFVVMKGKCRFEVAGAKYEVPPDSAIILPEGSQYVADATGLDAEMIQISVPPNLPKAPVIR
ncbi:MAG: hypothetical protein HY078_07875 [Elusimicrobia bacterium]|nr:hypothetical protein [Elusimicrobiota bacterium]